MSLLVLLRPHYGPSGPVVEPDPYPRFAQAYDPGKDGGRDLNRIVVARRTIRRRVR